jgi:hypothetical protein
MLAVTCNCPTTYVDTVYITCNFVETRLTPVVAAYQSKAFLIKPFRLPAPHHSIVVRNRKHK